MFTLNFSRPISHLYPPSCSPPPSCISDLDSTSGNERCPLEEDYKDDHLPEKIPTLLSPTRMMGSDELKTTVLGIAFEADTTSCLAEHNTIFLCYLG